MNDVQYQLNVVAAATGPGTKQDVAGVRDKYVQLTGVFSSTITIEGSLDGTTWGTLVAGLNAVNVITSIPQTVKFIRTNVTAYVSGQAGVLLQGFGVRDS